MTAADYTTPVYPPEPYSDDPYSSFFVVFRVLKSPPGYGVDSNGNVWTCAKMGWQGGISSAWRKLAPASQKSRHLFVSLPFTRGMPKLCRVHRLVMEAFFGPCPDGLQVRHLNGDPTDNRFSNLAYGTRKENSDDAKRHGRRAMGERHGCAKLTAEKVLEIRRLRATGMTCEAVAAMFGVSRSTVSLIARREKWTHLGPETDKALAAILDAQKQLF